MLPLNVSKEEIEQELQEKLKQLEGYRSIGVEEYKDLLRLYYRQMIIKNHYEGIVLTNEYLKPMPPIHISNEQVKNVLQDKYTYNQMLDILEEKAPYLLRKYFKSGLLKGSIIATIGAIISILLASLL